MWKLYFTTHSQFSFPFYPLCSVHVPNILHTYTYRQVHSLSFSRVFLQAAKRLLAIYAPSNSVCCLFAVSRAITIARWQQFLSSIDETSSKSSKNTKGKMWQDLFSKKPWNPIQSVLHFNSKLERLTERELEKNQDGDSWEAKCEYNG